MANVVIYSAGVLTLLGQGLPFANYVQYILMVSFVAVASPGVPGGGARDLRDRGIRARLFAGTLRDHDRALSRARRRRHFGEPHRRRRDRAYRR